MFDNNPLEFEVISVTGNPPLMGEVRQLLRQCGLGLDEDITRFVVARSGRRTVACAGLAGNIIKCVAVDPAFRGDNLSARIIGEVEQLAAQDGNHHLFLYTRPDNVPFFRGCGFFPLAEVPDTAVLLENTPAGLSRYCATLRRQAQPGKTIGCIVMNANPFTLGHLYLAEQAAAACDWLHIFVVSEDVSQFPFPVRLEMVRHGLAHLSRITVHPGTCYMISGATFPGYFLKERQTVNQAGSAMDLIIFRRYLAPALGITHRFVGTEPYSEVTARYNLAMYDWLENAVMPGIPAIKVVEIPRKLDNDGKAISASDVRRLLRYPQMNAIRALVPPSTLPYLQPYCMSICVP